MKISSVAPFANSIGVDELRSEISQEVQRTRSTTLAAVAGSNSSQTQREKQTTQEAIYRFADFVKKIKGENHKRDKGGQDKKRKKAISAYKQIDDGETQITRRGKMLNGYW